MGKDPLFFNDGPGGDWLANLYPLAVLLLVAFGFLVAIGYIELPF